MANNTSNSIPAATPLVSGTPVTGSTVANWTTTYSGTPVSKNAALFTVANWAGSGEVLLRLLGSWDGTVYWKISDVTVSGNGTYVVSAMEASTDQSLAYYTNAYAFVLPSTGTSATESASCTLTATLLSAP